MENIEATPNVPVLNKAQIEEIIPHRDPFMLIDQIIELEPGVRAVGTKTVGFDEFWIKGHFPQEPVQPGVLTLEMLAQVGAVCMMSLPANKGKIGYYAGIDNAKFRGKIIPGDTITLNCEIIKVRGPICIAKAAALVAGKTVASAELKFALGDSQ